MFRPHQVQLAEERSHAVRDDLGDAVLVGDDDHQQDHAADENVPLPERSDVFR